MRAYLNLAITICFALLAALNTTQSVHAWSSDAHRITAYMAQEMLTPTAKAVVAELLDGSDLAEASVYMDVYRLALA
jgi:hypothetical protein